MDTATRRALEADDDGVRGRIDALAGEYQLAEQAAGQLETLVRWLDWHHHNLTPATVPELPEPQVHLAPDEVAAASSMLREALSALELEHVRAAHRAADLGSGVGRPGLVLAIALPQVHMTLVEKESTKCEFLRRAAEALGLDNVEVEGRPAQQWREGRGTCDLVTARRIGRPHTILEWAAPLLNSTGAALVVRRRNSPSIEALAEAAAQATGLQLEAVHSFEREKPNGRYEPARRRLYLYAKAGQMKPNPARKAGLR